jgi:hypothetical protein
MVAYHVFDASHNQRLLFGGCCIPLDCSTQKWLRAPSDLLEVRAVDVRALGR